MKKKNKSKNKNKHIRAKLIANPGAGNEVDAPSLLEQAVRCLTNHGIKVDVVYASPKKVAQILAKKAVKKGYKIVIAMGGDGTIGEVIRGIAGSDVKLGVIVGGTMNDIAASLGIPEDVEAACALIAKGDTRELDLGQIKTHKHKKFYFFMVTVIGLTAALYPDVKKIPKGKLKEKFASMKDAIVTLVEHEAKPEVLLTFDDESKIKVETMVVTIANSPLIGSKNLVAPDASMEDGLFDISVFPDYNKAEVLSYFQRTAEENLISDGKLQRFRAHKVKVKSTPKLEIAADGISLGKGSCTIKMHRKALRVFVPPIGLGAEKSQEDGEEELSAPLSPFIKQNKESST
ncbi:diacylglycerol/lipid kinase family protein [Acetobacterium sp.]|uniref:diacylglycerol/lipid kinase family protein n=1 Tax=Acetobacterium sp. TaxID=1872094 RepID=UPI002F3F1CA8